MTTSQTTSKRTNHKHRAKPAHAKEIGHDMKKTGK